MLTVLGNILENAMEAVEPLPGEQRLIQLNISPI
ncbi:GHKL domain-containing protein [Moorella sp. Hama-1]